MSRYLKSYFWCTRLPRKPENNCFLRNKITNELIINRKWSTMLITMEDVTLDLSRDILLSFAGRQQKYLYQSEKTMSAQITNNRVLSLLKNVTLYPWAFDTCKWVELIEIIRVLLANFLENRDKPCEVQKFWATFTLSSSRVGYSSESTLLSSPTSNPAASLSPWRH